MGWIIMKIMTRLDMLPICDKQMTSIKTVACVTTLWYPWYPIVALSTVRALRSCPVERCGSHLNDCPCCLTAETGVHLGVVTWWWMTRHCRVQFGYEVT